MQELIAQITTIAKGMWRFRWQALLVTWIVGAIAATIALRVPDQYEATARIYVDTQTILKPLMAGLAIQPNVEQQVAMLSRTLISRPNVEKLVRMADLDLATQSKGDQDALISSVSSRMQIKNTGRDNLYTLSFRDEDSARAQRVIQSMVSIFVESSLGTSRKDNASAKQFINEQIKSYEAKLEQAEARLKEFRIKNIGIAGEGKDSAARLGSLREQLEQAKLELREAENARDAVKAQLKVAEQQGGAGFGSLAVPGIPATPIATPEIDARIDAQKRNLDALLQRFTDAHPDIVGTRRLISELEAQKQREIQELRRAAASAPVVAMGGGGNLMVQELNRMLASSEVQIAGMRARVGEYSARVGQAQEALKTAPQLEAEAAQLNRDYAINKSNYEALVARRESATMGGELEVASGVADFRLIDPPRVAPQPVFPNRFMLLTTALLAAIASGLFVAFAASQLRPVFHGIGDLRTQLSLPVLGAVSMVMGPDDKRRQRVDLIRFFVGSGSFIGVFVLGMVIISIIAARRVG
jgi:polysaccharide chain length determinant protein (PEP-CTERM system associated)